MWARRDGVLCVHVSSRSDVLRYIPAFRNEITPRNYVFRSREFEMMEIEYFIPPEAYYSDKVSEAADEQ